MRPDTEISAPARLTSPWESASQSISPPAMEASPTLPRNVTFPPTSERSPATRKSASILPPMTLTSPPTRPRKSILPPIRLTSSSTSKFRVMLPPTDMWSSLPTAAFIVQPALVSDRAQIAPAETVFINRVFIPKSPNHGTACSRPGRSPTFESAIAYRNSIWKRFFVFR